MSLRVQKLTEIIEDFVKIRIAIESKFDGAGRHWLYLSWTGAQTRIDITPVIEEANMHDKIPYETIQIFCNNAVKKLAKFIVENERPK